MAMDPVGAFKLMVEKARKDAEDMGGFPGSRYPYRVGMAGLDAVKALEARIEELENIVAAKNNILKGIQVSVNGHLEAEVALARPKEGG